MAVQNCAGLQQALAPLSDGSSLQPYVVLLKPGDYDCGTTTVFVPDWVTLQGIGGRAKTRILGSVENPLLGVVHLATGSQLRGLTVQNTATSIDLGAIALSVWRFGGGASGDLREVRLIPGAGANAYAVLAIAAQVRTHDAILEGSAHGDTGSNFIFRYSVLFTINPVVLEGGSSKSCAFTRRAFIRVDEDCEGSFF